MNKKILFVITKSNWGGAQKYVFDIASATQNYGYDVVVAHGGKGVLKEKLVEKDIRAVHIPELNRNISIIKEIKSFWHIYKIIKKERPDILHLNSSKIGILGGLAGRLCKVKKIIFTVHGLATNENRPWYQKVFFHTMYASAICCAHASIAVSEHIKRSLVLPSFLRKKIVVIHNGIDQLDHTYKTKEGAKKILSIETQMPLIMSIGELHPVKGFIYAIEAIDHLRKTIPHILYVILGEGEERKNIESYIKKHNLENNIILKGHVDNAAQYITAADIFLIPSITEAFGYVALEAGLAQVPIIASSEGGLPEIIKNFENGILVHSKNPREIANGITHLIEHPQLNSEYVKKMKSTVEQHFGLNKMVEKTIVIYENRV